MKKLLFGKHEDAGGWLSFIYIFFNFLFFSDFQTSDIRISIEISGRKFKTPMPVFQSASWSGSYFTGSNLHRVFRSGAKW